MSLTKPKHVVLLQSLDPKGPRSKAEVLCNRVNSFQVLGFAAFFALVLKKVEHEDEENTVIDGPLSTPGNCL